MSQDIAWDGVHALVGPTPVDARDGEAAPERAQAAPGAGFEIECADAARLAALGGHWRDLTRRADAANVFMHPLLLRAAIAAYPERRIRVLLAWQSVPEAQPQLAGVWAFAVGRASKSVLPFKVLSAPPAPNAYLATPVIDKGCLEPVLEALLTYIAADATLPNVVALEAMGADTATMAALAHVLAARHGRLRVFGRSQRPKLDSEHDGKTYLERAMSSSSRKKLRQHRRRLGEKGKLESLVVSDVAAVSRAFEDFLALEASGWKGRQGTALSSNPFDAQFARAMVAALAANGEADIHSLVLNGKPVSMQIVLRSGATAFTWKTAYDEALHDYSPGTLLFEDYTGRLLADKNVDIVDSCSFDDSGYMAAWQERAALARLWFDARPGGSAAFEILAHLQARYLAVRTRAKAFYRQHLRPNGRRLTTR